MFNTMSDPLSGSKPIGLGTDVIGETPVEPNANKDTGPKESSEDQSDNTGGWQDGIMS